ncbi:MAG: uracil-DNA glycosylase [Kiritimatiellae bacterium]|nr:uracil-DNA glycosylase [Kiritimatiellia bacterium]
MTLSRAATKLRSHLEHLKEEGVREIEASPERVAALRRRLKGLKTAPAVAAPVRREADLDVVAGLAKIAAEIAVCKKCRLCESRTNTVPGQGNTRPEIMFIGEGPGADEDAQGLAFVGRAGQLLTQIIEAMGFTRDEVFIGNVVKCRPPDNRAPMPDEMAACLPYLERQIALLKPKVIVALGATAVKGLFNDPKVQITKIRGRWMKYSGIDTMPTLHPAYLLRNPPAKRDVWEDMKTVLAHLGRPIPSKRN